MFFWCYTEKAPNAWHRRGTQKTRNTYNQPNRPSLLLVWFLGQKTRYECGPHLKQDMNVPAIASSSPAVSGACLTFSKLCTPWRCQASVALSMQHVHACIYTGRHACTRRRAVMTGQCTGDSGSRRDSGPGFL